ncbi:hypothetical protein BHM03_00019433 [Ensete ventricosum]|nr:hypothetical protein BHM03_00019433 [Ensete ventricosum]
MVHMPSLHADRTYDDVGTQGYCTSALPIMLAKDLLINPEKEEPKMCSRAVPTETRSRVGLAETRSLAGPVDPSRTS